MQTHALMLLFILFFLNKISYSADKDHLNLTTYNTGLAHTFVPLAKERLPHLIKKFKAHNSDVLCLQEVWESSDKKAILKELKSIYPYSFSVKKKQSYTKTAPACYPTDLIGSGKFGNCLLGKCRKKKGDAFTKCVVNTCGESLKKLKSKRPQCAAALISQVGRPMMKGLFTILNPFKKTGLYTYEGSNGLVLLSKYPLMNKKLIDMTDISTTVRRSALFATIDPAPNKAPVHLLCTHLSANLAGVIPYTGQLKNWAEENAQQMERLLEFEQDVMGKLPHNSKDTFAIMGDFNCSLPDAQFGIEEEFLGSCIQPSQVGLQDPIISITRPQCSYCAQNPLIKARSAKENVLTNHETLNENETGTLLDHIFLDSPFSKSEQLDAKIIFKELTTIKEMERGGNFYKVPLSDHYGVQVKIPLH